MSTIRKNKRNYSFTNSGMGSRFFRAPTYTRLPPMQLDENGIPRLAS